jgi:tyrosine-protein phosphatase SIW14
MTSKALFFRLSVFAFLLATTAYVGAHPQAENAATPSAHTAGKRLTAKGIPNFGQVTPKLFRGAQPNTDGLQELKNMGVDLIVDLRGSSNKSEEATAARLGMGFVSIPSHCPFPSDAPWAHFLKVMRENRDKKVFVHCRWGKDRTGLAVAAYRMSEEGWSPAEALQEMKMFGFSSVHHVTCPGLEGYVERFPERLKSSPAFRELSPQK